MAKVVELTIPTEQFALAETLESLPEAQFEAVPVVAHPSRGAMTFFSVTSSLPDQITETLEADETTAEVVELSQRSERQLYHVSWQARVRTVLRVLLQTTGTLLCAWGAGDQWELRLLFPEQEVVSEICANWRTHGIEPSIQRVVSVAGEFGLAEMDLSSCQHDTLLRAYEMNYYDVPRGATLERVATDLRISHQALSERLRRGHRNLIQTTLCESPTPLPTQ